MMGGGRRYRSVKPALRDPMRQFLVSTIPVQLTATDNILVISTLITIHL